MSNLRQVTLQQLKQNLVATQLPRRIDEVILHHTWAPTAAQYQGLATWQGIKNYHMHTRGWSDIGYHLGIAPDDTIWLLRPIARSGGHTLGHNAHSVGVVLIGNFDSETPTANGLYMAARVVATVCKRYKLTNSNVYFHRDFADKSCPGRRIDRALFRDLVSNNIDKSEAMQMPNKPDVSPWAEDAVAWVRAEGLMTNDIMDNKFHGQDAVTREELAVVLKRLHDHFYR